MSMNFVVSDNVMVFFQCGLSEKNFFLDYGVVFVVGIVSVVEFVIGMKFEF